MKKILLSLFIGLIGLISFGYCENVPLGDFEPFTPTSKVSDGFAYNRYTLTTSANSTRLITLSTDYDFYCMRHDNGVVYISEQDLPIGSSDWDGVGINSLSCFPGGSTYYVYGGAGLNVYMFRLGDGIVPTLSSLECQTEYNLIPVSSVDQNYCVNNNLCPSSDCPDIPGSGDNWSALYINDIQHLGKPIINITFPDYLDWDYTTNENEFNLDIVGYPVDTEYIDGIIRTQNYKPTSEDFTQLVGMLAPYSKYLLFLLFIFIIWAWIKKPFKSKKL